MPDPATKLDPPRIVLHVGLHKSGTTYLQNLCRANRGTLAAQGIHFPGGPGEPVQRMAAYDLLGKRPGGVNDKRVTGQWQALVDLVSTSPHPTVLVSEEGLSFSTPSQVAACVRAFPDRDVHVLVTCRDLGRVLVSAWQEEIKNDQTWTWSDYAAGVKDPARRGQNPGRGFWRAQDLPAILETWRTAVPAERIHVVTVPPRGAPEELLLGRIAEVVGFDPQSLTERAPRDNASLGPAGTEVIRRLNANLDHRLNQRQHSHLVKGVLVPELVAEERDQRYGLPREERAWVEDEARRQIARVDAGGYSLVGDWTDLLPTPATGARSPDEFTTDEVAALSLVALAGLGERYASHWWRRRKDDEPVVPPTSRRVRLASAARGLTYATRRTAAGLADRNQSAAQTLSWYLRITQRRR